MADRDFYRLVNERLTYFVVHWGRGCQLMLPYSGVRFASITRTGKLLIMSSGITVEAIYKPPGARSRAEKRVAEAAGLPRYEDEPGNWVKGRDPATSPASPLVEAANTPRLEPPPENEQTLQSFVDHFSQLRVHGLFHNAEVGFVLRVYRMTADGPEPFPEE